MEIDKAEIAEILLDSLRKLNEQNKKITDENNTQLKENVLAMCEITNTLYKIKN